MNIEAIRKKFEETEQVAKFWGGCMEYDDESNKYYPEGYAIFEDADALNKRWIGYQQAVKDMESEIEKLKDQLNRMMFFKQDAIAWNLKNKELTKERDELVTLLEIAISTIDFSSATTKVVSELGQAWKDKYEALSTQGA